MVGASSRLLLLLTSQLSFLHHRPSVLLRLTRRHSLSLPLPPLSTVPNHLPPRSRVNSLLPIKSSQQFHSQTTSNAQHENNHPPADGYIVPPSHPWPEWSHLLHSLSAAGYYDRNSNRIEKTDIEDEFVANENLSMEFVAAATSCLNFARDRPDILGFLPRGDIQVVTENGTPFLFKNAHETERRMRSFAEGEESIEARTVDLMKYVMSYASNPIIYPERNIGEVAESSVRNLLREMADLSGRRPTPYLSAQEHFQASFRDEQAPQNLVPNITITMKRGDWICPKCNFMNFARNTKCLECEQQRPRRQLTGGEWDCPQCNFFNYRRNVVCLRCECKRPDEVNSQYPNGLGYGSTNDSWGTKKTIESSVNRNFNNTSAGFDKYTTSIGGGQTARKDGRPPIPKGSNYGYPPFVPLPADMFAKKTQKIPNDDTEEGVMRSSELSPSRVGDPKYTVSESKEPVKLGEESHPSENSASQVQSEQIKETDEDDKAERWFKKVKELHDVTDLPSGSPNEDFPAIMPMRKGENRFVVSKKKDRSLTSPEYKRQQAMEQGSNINFVPFVPFPPDYFAKKDDKPRPNTTGSADESSPNQISHENSSDATRDTNIVQGTANQEATSSVNLLLRSTFDGRGTSDRNAAANSSSAQVKETRAETLNADQQAPENQNVRSRCTGKSLEGSAVTEPDPLDMSEEAKAERWFRRVAQIKDISELSQIPDEDFPSIMPMRKGVNRFVVSKRKTPLERRLTSPQYRKNLRVVSSDPVKKEGDGSNER